MRNFPGSFLVKIPCFHCRGAQVQSLVMELTPCNLAKTKKMKRIWNPLTGTGLRKGEKEGSRHCDTVILSFCSVWNLSVQFSCSVVSDSLRTHRLQHANLPVHHQLPEFTQTHVHWVSDAIQPSHSLSSPSPFPSLQSFPESGSFQMNHFESAGQSSGVSASASVLPMNIQDWFPLGWTGWISLQAFLLADSQESSPTPQFKNINFSALSFLYSPTLMSIHDYWKNHSLD